jgi:hypothetical protein
MITAIASQLPNGFHDALLEALHVEFAREEVQLGFKFLVGTPDAETEELREAMRPGLLRLTGVTSMLIEAPDPRYNFSMDDGVSVDGGFGAYPGETVPSEDGLLRLWLFISTWNARMMFAAKSCDLVWTDRPFRDSGPHG